MLCCFGKGPSKEREQALPSKDIIKNIADKSPADFMKTAIPLSLSPQIKLTCGKDMKWSSNNRDEGRTIKKGVDPIKLKQELQRKLEQQGKLERQLINLKEQIKRKGEQAKKLQSGQLQSVKNQNLVKVLNLMISKERLQIMQYQDLIS